MQTFESLTKSLNILMIEDFLAVNLTKNPVLQIIHRASFEELTYIVRQYSIFPKLIVDLMRLAEQKTTQAQWHGIAAELQKNIIEEMGSSSGGIPHYDLFTEGLEAGLKLPIKSTFPSQATQVLLKTMDGIFSRPIAYFLGAIYAIEATSISELNLIKQIVKVLLQGTLSKDLQYFFDMHLNEWEPEHEEDLRRSLEAYIDPQEFNAFAEGFQAALTAMDIWWLQLTAEAMSQRFILQAA